MIPTREELWLLKACLSKDQEVVQENFEAWIKYHDFKVSNVKATHILPNIYDNMEMGSKKMLPLLYKNMDSIGLKNPITDQLKGYYKYTWYKNQMLKNQIMELIPFLISNSIDYFLIKGLTLIDGYYKNIGARPTSDIDIVLRKGDCDKFIDFACQSGWKTKKATHRKSVNNLSHAITLYKDQFELDIHWRFIQHPISVTTEKNIFKNEIVTNTGYNVLSDTMNLITVIIHAFDWNEMRSIRWVADSVKIIENSKNIDWELLIQFAKESDTSIPITTGLTYLKANFSIEIPDSVLPKLGKLKVTNKKIENFYLTIQKHKKSNDFSQFLKNWHFARIESNNLLKAISKLIKHYQSFWGKSNIASVFLFGTLITIEKTFFKNKRLVKR